MKFTEAQLEQAIIDLLGKEHYPHVLGTSLVREKSEVLIKEDFTQFLNPDMLRIISRIQRLLPFLGS